MLFGQRGVSDGALDLAGDVRPPRAHRRGHRVRQPGGVEGAGFVGITGVERRFRRFRRAAETPFNLVYEIRP
jgi:hypothetical protein